VGERRQIRDDGAERDVGNRGEERIMNATIRILYVDDEPELLEIGKLFLEESGDFTVITAISAHHGIQLLESEKFDAIISDYQMPGMDGLEFLKHVRLHQGQVPFILFTGRGREEVVIRALNNGADSYLQKGGEPVSQFAELAHKINHAVKRKQSEVAFKESEKKFRYLVENALEAILILDFQGKVLFANNAVKILVETGDYAGLIGMNVMDFVAHESREDVTRDFILVSKGHDAFLSHYQVITAKGKKICVECIGKQVTYDGKPADLLSLRDITESKQQEEVVRQKNLVLTTLNDMQREFAELPAGKRVEELAVTMLSNLSGAIVTVFCTYDPVDQMLKASVIHIAPGMWEGIPGALDTALGLLGKGLDDIQYPLTNEMYQDISRSTVGRKKTITELSYGQIPPLISTSIQKLAGIDHFIHVAHIIDGVLYGTSVIGLKSGQPDPSRELLESFAHMVAVSLRRQRAEGGLRESEERFRLFIEQALEGISIVDEEGRIIEWNPALEQITGMSRTEVMGVCPWDLATRMIPDRHRREEISARIKESTLLTLKSGVSAHPDPAYYRFKRPDGTIGVAKQTVFIVKTSHGHMIGTLYQDATAERQADEKIKESEELLRDIIEKNPMSIQIVDKDGFTLRVNPAHTLLFGSVPPPDFSIFVDLVNKQPELEKLISLVKSGEPVDLPDIYFNAHDSYPECPDVPVWVRALIFPLKDKHGKPERFVFMHENITEQKRAEEALRGQRQILEAIIDNVPARVFWKDKKLTFLGCNTQFARDAGFEKPEDVIGKDDYSMGWRKQAELYRADDRLVIESGKPRLLIEEPQTTPTGELISLLTSKVPLKDETDEIVGVLGTYLDITERKRAEELVRESENKFISVFSGSPVALTLVSATDGRFVNINDAFVRSTGYTHEEVVGKTSEDLGIFADDNERGMLASALRDRHIVEDMEIRCRTKTGEIRPCLFSSGIIMIGGKPHILSSVRDNKARKQAEEALKESEEKFREIFENANDAITVLGFTPEGLPSHFTDVNENACQISGYTREEMLSMSPKDLDDPGEWNEAQGISQKIMERGDLVFERNLVRKDGNKIPIEISTHVFTLKNQNVMLSIFRDISKRKQAEDAIRQANRKLKLLSSITRHDMNNQLLVLNGFLNILHKKVPDEQLEDFFTKIRKASSRISSMIQFTREYEEIGVNAPVWQECRELVDTAAKEAPLGQVTLKNDLAAGAEVFADPLIRKVFYNLMDNATRYGGKITTIRFSAMERGDDLVVFCEDDGEGVPANEKDKIFERGFGKNTGLGLALSCEILAITGITIRETGEPGKGARFEMVVPKGRYR
jgi:PAS domain S-box-containing protein